MKTHGKIRKKKNRIREIKSTITMKTYVIINLNHPKLINQAIAHEIVKKVPHVKLDDIRDFWGSDYKQLLEILDKIIDWGENERD